MEYLMDGFNKDWMPLSANETSISFSNLPSGNYTFRLRKLNGIAANSYIEGSIAFSVEKKFYESGTFLLLIIAGLSSFILLLLKFNSQRIIKKNLDLEKSIGERTKELKKANLLLEENNSELAQKEQFLKDSILVKDRLISVISHDIITPLKFISMVSRISKKNPDMLDRNKLIDSMNDIEFASDKLYNNASNILNWMKFQNNRITPKLDYIAIHDFVGEVSDPLIGMLDIKGLKIENNIPEEDIIITDRNILTIILQNILSNAIKYSNSGNITFTANHQNSNYLMSITDNGIGMSPATLANIEKIKSRKVHFSATDFNPDTSSNLGYYIIVDFLQLLGGVLDVKSVPGKGTTVTIAIPIPS
ncbi:MAG: HAMP domain-containing histidine kinase [Bacteroidetes bacterium]|nr:HAMP domain-containing histidine kinase [Bacteroidota bacterium]